MAEEKGLGFFGRVRVDTLLVNLLDAVTKGEIVGADAMESGGANGADTSGQNDASTNGQEVANGHGDEFPLLTRYNQTASARVWKGITEGILSEIEARRADITARLQQRAEA